MLNSHTIEGFVTSVLSRNFDDRSGTPEFHRECWELCTSSYQYVAIAAPRGHSKSTGITMGYGLATLLFRERKYMLLVSDTEGQAALFLGNIKQQLIENEELIELFGLKRNEKGEVAFLKETETDIIVEFTDGNKFRIMAKGAEQKLRGMLWNGTRPDIIIADDMENDELVMNKERRAKLKNWFYKALLPCLSRNGIVRIVGTILHVDSVLESLMPGMHDKFTVEEGLKIYSTRKRVMWKAVKYRAHSPDYSEILWPERFDASYFKERRAEYMRQGMADGYAQEYLNHPLDESVSFFKKTDFIPPTDEEKKRHLHYYITVDLAISKDETADYSVFLIAGVDENKIIHIVNVIRERLDGREIVDTILALHRTYNPQAIGIEEMQISKSIGPFLYESMITENCYPTLVKLKHGGKDKISRARSIQARTRAKGVRFYKDNEWFDVFHDECMMFPRSKHDDQVDCFAYLGLMLNMLSEAPTEKQLQEDEYLEELENGFTESGRNEYTGY